jgi:hypothetical protein
MDMVLVVMMLMDIMFMVMVLVVVAMMMIMTRVIAAAVFSNVIVAQKCIHFVRAKDSTTRQTSHKGQEQNKRMTENGRDAPAHPRLLHPGVARPSFFLLVEYALSPLSTRSFWLNPQSYNIEVVPTGSGQSSLYLILCVPLLFESTCVR